MFITSRSKQRKAIKSKYAPGFLPENWSFVCLLCYVGLNRLKVSAFCRSGFFKYDGGSQRKALWWSSFLHQCVTLELQLYFPSADTIWLFDLSPDLITESVLLVFTPLSKFFLSWSYRKGPKEKRLNAHIIMTEFPWLVHHKPGFQLLGALKERAITWGWMSSSRSGNGWIQHSVRVMSCILAPVEGLWGLQSPPGQAGPSHPLGWGADRGECCGSLDMGLWQPSPVWGCAWGHGSLLWKSHLSLWADLERKHFLLIRSDRAQTRGRKSLAYKFAQ